MIGIIQRKVEKSLLNFYTISIFCLVRYRLQRIVLTHPISLKKRKILIKSSNLVPVFTKKKIIFIMIIIVSIKFQRSLKNISGPIPINFRISSVKNNQMKMASKMSYSYLSEFRQAIVFIAAKTVNIDVMIVKASWFMMYFNLKFLLIILRKFIHYYQSQNRGGPITELYNNILLNSMN